MAEIMRSGTLRLVMAGAVALPMLTACETTGGNQQMGQLGGAAVGGILGGIAGGAIGGNRTGAVIGALAGAAAGYFIGGAIANALSNPADREKASTATQKVLDAPAPATYNTAASGPATTNSAARQPQQTRPVQASWRSDSSNSISGSSTLTSVQRANDGGECRTVREVAYVQGKEVQQDTRYCRNPGGGWAQA